VGWRCIITESQRDLSVFAPRIKAPADELRAVVDADHRRKAAVFFDLF
jgi:hypothetical protein